MKARTMQSQLKASLAIVMLMIVSTGFAADWPNAGGNAGRNGLSTELGPTAAQILWSGGRPSIIAWQPVTEGNRLFMVRQTGFPPGGEPNGSPVVAMNLETGAELYTINVPFATGDWTTWIAGVRDGRVYASRAGNGASVSAPMYAYDVTNGAYLWTSEDEIDAGAYDGVVFAPDGDLIVASFQDIWRINASDGTTQWHATRTASVSGNCGGAATEDALYVVDTVAGGQAIVKYDLATGQELYTGSLMPGFLMQNTPMVGPDGTIYVSRVQNNTTVDFFYAMTDTGSAIVPKWHVAAAYTAGSEFGVGPDGSVYMLRPGFEFVRLDPDDGTVIDTAGVLSGFSKPRMAIDAAGRVYLSNGAFATGRLYAFEADLTPIWDVAVTNINIGGPILAQNGTLVVCGVGNDVRAYRTPVTACEGDADDDGTVDFGDVLAVLNAWGPCPPPCTPDVDGSGDVDFGDLLVVLNDWGCAR